MASQKIILRSDWSIINHGHMNEDNNLPTRCQRMSCRGSFPEEIRLPATRVKLSCHALQQRIPCSWWRLREDMGTLHPFIPARGWDPKCVVSKTEKQRRFRSETLKSDSFITARQTERDRDEYGKKRLRERSSSQSQAGQRICRDGCTDARD